MVDSVGEVGDYSSIAVDPLGRPRIAYYAEGTQSLMIARWTAAGWSRESVDSDDDSGTSADLAIDASGGLHVSYTRFFGAPGRCDLRYARWSGASWSIETVISSWAVGEPASIALDPTGRPEIVYYHRLWPGGTLEDLELATRSSGGWTLSTVALAGDVGQHNDVIVDASGTRHIAYRDEDSETLRYARSIGVGWITEIVDDQSGTGRDPSIALDSSGRPCIAYTHDYDADSLAAGLRYACRAGSSSVWTIETVVPDLHLGPQGSLAFDSYGAPTIAYLDFGPDDLRIARRTVSGWRLMTVDADDRVGWRPSLAFDAMGNAHISYQDYDLNHLKYAFVPRGWDGAR